MKQQLLIRSEYQNDLLKRHGDPIDCMLMAQFEEIHNHMVKVMMETEFQLIWGKHGKQ
jgi:hypothetical protein